MEETVDYVKKELRQQGYYSTSHNSELKTVHDYGAKKSSSGAGHAGTESNAIFNVDTYKFENDNGDKLQFQVQYMVKEDKNNVMLAEISTTGCETTNPKAYDNLCGSKSPIKSIDNIPPDGTAKVANPAGTAWLSIGIVALLLPIPFIMLLSK